VQTTLEQLGIGDKWRARIGEVSGGECQRAAIARALVKRPQLILADEPTGNLDGKTAEVIVGEMKRLRDQGVGVLMVTHNEKIAEKYADRIITLRDGLIESDERRRGSGISTQRGDKLRQKKRDGQSIEARGDDKDVRSVPLMG